jgi:hypothetical protein
MKLFQQSIEEDQKIRHQWKLVTEKVTNERGAWPATDPGRWKLDPTEGCHVSVSKAHSLCRN